MIFVPSLTGLEPDVEPLPGTSMPGFHIPPLRGSAVWLDRGIQSIFCDRKV